MDIFGASIALMVFSPVFLIVLCILFIENPGNVWFRQQRIGQNQKPFNILKFKTMNDKRDAVGLLLPDGQRITAFGSRVRALSLDELPQLINVLKGDMSLVGPRPLLVEYLPLYSAMQARRHEVRPGITGLAQVNGRNSISWTRKFEYDAEYVDRIGFFIDIRIICLTLVKVFTREGVNHSPTEPMPPFNGNN
ncbi:Lipid carrier : UDP-N-acetylgalactosaminyltransferase [Lunatimonas lonarensis]|uniref:Lipid carrier: UDP-N-acetylgalactosaminyltransferase n=2 Tax=Lunatimonas lonarensis TaxID=1232681 RepID=R7ZZE4_9BACT|nr:Lipid carrier : UDP-N-acetylgalactosaminyltransferase [Lunatimonas lonarensis]